MMTTERKATHNERRVEGVEMESIGSIIHRIYGSHGNLTQFGIAMVEAAEDDVQPVSNVVDLHGYSKKV